MEFKRKKPHFEHLKNKWTRKQSSTQSNLLDKHIELRHLAAGSLGGLLLLTTPTLAVLPQATNAVGGQIQKNRDNNAVLADQLSGLVPPDVRVLTSIEEEQIAAVLLKNFGFGVSASLDGKRLNRSYGLIGGEQHLYRYPGDNLYKHADNAQEWAMYGGSGIAPGLGAWGYFAPSESQLTEQDIQREKYYIAVQTFLAPGYAENTVDYRDFFKYRKVLVVNPKTGQAVVADIADAGPAEWTGKHLGGSPEVMQALGLAQGPRKGAVLYFFIDDPNDKIPLGPKSPNTNLNQT